MKTKIASKTASVAHSILGQSAGVTDPIPTESAPTPPTGYVPVRITRGNRPRRSQVAIAAKAAGEIRGNASYVELFGSAAPDPTMVADALTTAAEWSASLQNAEAWYLYVKQQEWMAWKHAFGLTDPLRVPFEFRLSRDATLGQTLPSVAKFYAASTESAQKALATRKRNKAAAAKKGAATAALATAAPATISLAEDPVKAAAVKLLN